MEDEVKYEKIIEQARELSENDQLRLINDLSASLRNQIHYTDQTSRTSADYYGAMRGVAYEESDFEAAEWHPEL